MPSVLQNKFNRQNASSSRANTNNRQVNRNNVSPAKPKSKAASQQKKSERKKKVDTKSHLLAINKGWTKDDTQKIKVNYRTIEDMINPIRMCNEHERAVREMIWMIRRLEKLTDEEIASRLPARGLSTPLNALWRKIEPKNVRAVYIRSLKVIVEEYSKRDKRVLTFLLKIESPITSKKTDSNKS